ncbi:MAG: HAMP domain-containing histidine kinase [bacterium]|nr:HAMP domain-containing histidine kinase [bacterium]
MLRRLLPTVLALVLCLTVLTSGLIGLERVFRRERDEARQAIESQRRALEQVAHTILARHLDRTLATATARSARAARDPLLPAGHLLRFERGRQLLPRLFSFRPGSETPARKLFEALVAGELPDGDTATPWGERLALHRAFSAALRAGDETWIESSFRTLLRHRSRYRIAAERDLPAALALLHVFARDSEPAPELLRALLHDGLDDGRGGRIRDLSRLLLEHRERFTRPDFLFLCERLVELAADANVPHQPFLERSRDASARPLVIPAEVGEPTLLAAGRWLAGPDVEGSVAGVAVELRLVLEEVTRDMRERGLSTEDEVLRLVPEPSSLALPVRELELRLASDRWQRLLAVTERRHQMKAGLVALAAVLGLSMAGLAIALQARRARLLAVRSELIATVSHELKTPLASVRLLAETVAKRARGPELKDYPERIVREIDRLNFLVGNILSFNRLEKGRIEPRLSLLSLDELLAEVRSEVETHVDREVTLEQMPDGDLVADPELMKLMFANLVRNACAYNDRDPVIFAVEHRTVAEGGIEILVRDNGRGIPEPERPKIFDDFYRPPESDASSVGTGLGLAICRRVVELHRGSIRVADSGPEGTTFRIEIPSLEARP